MPVHESLYGADVAEIALRDVVIIEPSVAWECLASSGDSLLISRSAIENELSKLPP